MLFLLLFACEEEPEIDIITTAEADTDTDADADTDTDTEGSYTDHCGDITTDQTWTAAANPHRISCAVDVLGAVLTLEAGVEVEVDDADGITVGNSDYGGSLVIAGTEAQPVRLHGVGSSDGGVWDGIVVNDLASGVSLSWTTIEGGGGAARGALYSEAPLLLDHVTIGASEDHGLELTDGAYLMDGSNSISVSDAGALFFPISLVPAAVATLPIGNLDVSNNPQAMIRIEAGDLGTSATWADPGVPYVVDGRVDVEGTADNPAILTIGPGTTVQVARSGGIRIASTGGAGGLRALGTSGAPVAFTAFGAALAGYWDGIEALSGTSSDALTLTHTTVSYAGGGTHGAAVYVADAELLADSLTITDCEDLGLYLSGDAQLAEGSDDITVEGCARPGRVPAHALGRFVGVDTTFVDNTEAQLIVDGDDISSAMTWPRLDVPYWVQGDVNVDGTVPDPAVLTLTAGTTFYMANDAGIFVGRHDGASALVAVGTESNPIVFRAGDAEVKGQWCGIGLYDTSDDALSIFDHVEIAHGGGSTLSGNIHLSSASPRIDHTTLTDSDEYGLYLSTDAAPTLGTVTYSGNRLGDTN